MTNKFYCFHAIIVVIGHAFNESNKRYFLSYINHDIIFILIIKFPINTKR